MVAFTTPDGFVYETTKDQPGTSLRAPDEILAEQVQTKVASIDADVADLTQRLDYHEAVFDTAGESSDINITGSEGTLVSVSVDVPSHWSTWQAEIRATTQIENVNVGGTAAASDRRLTLKADDSSSQIGFAFQYTLEAAKDDDIITATFSNPSGSAAGGTITFRLRASLTTNDNYRATVSTIAVTLHRLT